ncbi:MAG: HAD family phosphatase [Candidatus Micrarchaeota archaeon]
MPPGDGVIQAPVSIVNLRQQLVRWAQLTASDRADLLKILTSPEARVLGLRFDQAEIDRLRPYLASIDGLGGEGRASGWNRLKQWLMPRRYPRAKDYVIDPNQAAGIGFEIKLVDLKTRQVYILEFQHPDGSGRWVMPDLSEFIVDRPDVGILIQQTTYNSSLHGNRIPYLTLPGERFIFSQIGGFAALRLDTSFSLLKDWAPSSAAERNYGFSTRYSFAQRGERTPLFVSSALSLSALAKSVELSAQAALESSRRRLALKTRSISYLSLLAAPSKSDSPDDLAPARPFGMKIAHAPSKPLASGIPFGSDSALIHSNTFSPMSESLAHSVFIKKPDISEYFSFVSPKSSAPAGIDESVRPAVLSDATVVSISGAQGMFMLNSHRESPAANGQSVGLNNACNVSLVPERNVQKQLVQQALARKQAEDKASISMPVPSARTPSASPLSHSSTTTTSVSRQQTKISAVLFDLDGVLADSEELHRKTFNEVFAPFGVSISKSYWYAHYTGTGSRHIVHDLLQRHHLAADENKLVEERKALFAQEISQGHLEPVDGAPELVSLVQSHSLKAGVASGGHNSNVRAQLVSLGLGHLPSVGLEDIQNRKPDPEAFLLMARRLGVEPSACLVVEDSAAGLAAAKRAGMACLLIGKHHPKSIRAQADLWVSRLSAKKVGSFIKKLAGFS